MNNIDAPVLRQHLTLLHELYRVRPPSPEVVKVWLEALKPWPIGDVADVLIAWPTVHGEAPRINVVLEDLRRAHVGRRAAEVEREAKRAPLPVRERTPAELAFVRARLEEIRAILRRPSTWRHPETGRPAMPYRGHVGGALAAAFGGAGQESDAEREARAEREAIQNEGAPLPAAAL